MCAWCRMYATDQHGLCAGCYHQFYGIGDRFLEFALDICLPHGTSAGLTTDEMYDILPD